MKNLNVILSRTVLIGLISLSIACADKKNDSSNAENEHNQEMHNDKMNHDGKMQNKEMNQDAEMMRDENYKTTENSDMKVSENKTASTLIDNYLAIKNALVNDDQDAAQKAAESLGKSVINFDVNTIENSKQEEASEILEKLKIHAEHISKMDISHQRAHFAEINTNMKNLLAITGSDRMLYQQYCPMYDDNNGGAWLSASKDIKNPLFGSKMLKCGSVKQTIVLE